jgi:uncharacterized OB-fold protein
MAHDEAGEGFVRRTGGPDWIPYWEAARRRELRFQRCTDCGRWRFPPGPLCPGCLSSGSEWARASGRARLLSWVVCHPPVLPAWQARTPYAVVLVECEEGVRTMGNVIGAGPEALRMDIPMLVDFAPSPDGDLVPQWRPDPGRTEMRPGPR